MSTPNLTLPAHTVRRRWDGGWCVAFDTAVTDEQAAAVTIQVPVYQATIGAFVSVADPEGERIGRIHSATLDPRDPLGGRPTATLTVDLM